MNAFVTVSRRVSTEKWGGVHERIGSSMRTRREADSSATPATRLGKPNRRSGRRRREAVVVSNKPNRNRFDPMESIAGWSSGFRWPRRREEAVCGSESTGIRDRSDYSELLGRSSSFSRPLPRVRSRSAPARLTQVMVTGEELCESDRESHEAGGLGLAGRNEFLTGARCGFAWGITFRGGVAPSRRSPARFAWRLDAPPRRW